MRRAWLAGLFFLAGQAAALEWLLSQLKTSALASSDVGMASDGAKGPGGPALCHRIPGLTKPQKKLCNRHPEVVSVVEAGVAAGMAECQREFADQRWNCSTREADAVLRLGSREGAFMHAMASAAAVARVAKECASGRLADCGCAPAKTGLGWLPDGQKFAWGGCGDNLKFAAAFARKFLDSRDRAKRRDQASLMHLHNNRAGRKAAKRSVKLSCKCHGISGACTTRTCWRAVPPLSRIAAQLHEKYSLALKVKVGPSGSSLVPALHGRLADEPMDDGPSQRRARRKVRIGGTELVFFSPSPDWCTRDGRTGSLGTGGRRCSATSRGPDSCALLCCGRGWETRLERVERQCRCRFKWCCEVVCQTCVDVVERHTCRPDSPAHSAHYRLSNALPSRSGALGRL